MDSLGWELAGGEVNKVGTAIQRDRGLMMRAAAATPGGSNVTSARMENTHAHVGVLIFGGTRACLSMEI